MTDSGHLFIVRGDITRLSCDAWLLPTDVGITVEPNWLAQLPETATAEFARARKRITPAWEKVSERVMEIQEWPEQLTRPWLVNVAGLRAHSLEGAVREFIEKAAGAIKKPRNSRQRPLLALPVITTGRGGGYREKGRVIHHLVEVLGRLAEEFGIDLTLVTFKPAATAGAQQARAAHKLGWPALGEVLENKAKSLADIARRRGLALFLGAGVSCSAGLPSWNGMLERLARDIGFEGAELDEFSKLDMLDRGSILARRFRAQGKEFNRVVAALFANADQHSLLHAFLANLPASEAITQNYDVLFERAAEGAGAPVATLPYSSGDHHERWLLKMHGCVTRPEDIVIQREDYIRYSQRRAALAGIVGATMLTRWMLFVGFSLRDGNFHRAVDDVRRAAEDRPMSRIGTALFVTPSDLTAELWQEELDILSFGEEKEEAARRLEIFMDCVLAHCGGTTHHLLDPTFTHLLSKPEQEIKASLLRLAQSLSPQARSSAAYERIHQLLTSLGYPGGKREDP